jgi:hypothetical protein
MLPDFIDRTYNTERFAQFLGYLPPVEFEVESVTGGLQAHVERL